MQRRFRVVSPTRSGTGPLAPDRDVELVAAAQDGDMNAFEMLYDRHKKRIYSLCLRMLHNPTEAEDLTQDTFVQLFRRLGTFRREAAFSTWLHRLAVNMVLMWLRKRRLPTVPLEEPATHEEEFELARQFGQTDTVLAGSGDRIDIVSAIDLLPPGYRLIFILHDIEGYEHCEIAAILGCTVGNSKSQLHKARLKLRSLLAEAAPGKLEKMRTRAGARGRRQRAKVFAMRPSSRQLRAA